MSEKPLSKKKRLAMAKNAEVAVRAWMAHVSDTPTDHPICEEDIHDLVTELLHLCDKKGWDPEEAARWSRAHFLCEKHGED